MTQVDFNNFNDDIEQLLKTLYSLYGGSKTVEAYELHVYFIKILKMKMQQEYFCKYLRQYEYWKFKKGYQRWLLPVLIESIMDSKKIIENIDIFTEIWFYEYSYYRLEEILDFLGNEAGEVVLRIYDHVKSQLGSDEDFSFRFDGKVTHVMNILDACAMVMLLLDVYILREKAEEFMELLNEMIKSGKSEFKYPVIEYLRSRE